MKRIAKTYTIDIEVIQLLDKIRKNTRLNFNLIIEDCIREYYKKHYGQ